MWTLHSLYINVQGSVSCTCSVYALELCWCGLLRGGKGGEGYVSICSHVRSITSLFVAEKECRMLNLPLRQGREKSQVVLLVVLPLFVMKLSGWSTFETELQLTRDVEMVLKDS